MSMISCIPLCGSFLNGALVPTIYERHQSFGEAFRIGFILCLVSLVLVLILTYIDYKTEQYDRALLVSYVSDKMEQEKKERATKKMQGHVTFEEDPMDKDFVKLFK